MHWKLEQVQLKSLKNKNPFLYKIEDDLYFLGSGMCQKLVSKDFERYYAGYSSAVNECKINLLELNKEIDSDTMDSLIYYHKKLNSMGRNRMNDERFKEGMELLTNLLNTIKDDDDLLEQLRINVAIHILRSDMVNWKE